MSRIPQTFIDDLLTRIDIVELIDARVPLKKRGNNFMACCPFHNEKTPSFTVSQNKQFYHCFGCGANGTAISFLMEYDRLEFRDAIQQLAQQLGMELPADVDDGSARASRQPLYDALDQANRWYQEQLREYPPAVNYLKQRGLTGNTAKTFGIGWAPDAWQGVADRLKNRLQAAEQAGLVSKGQKDAQRYFDRFRGRIMFPIRDTRGRVIGFGGRVTGNDEPKYLNSPETPVFHKGRELYGLYEARQANRELPRVLIVEGYMDVVMLAQHGVTNAVATLGTATTPEHIEKLYRLTSELVFCFDGDRAGRAAAWRALEHALPAMRDGRQAKFLFLPDGEDPDSMVQKEGQAAFEQRVKQAHAATEFLLDKLANECDLASLDGRARLIELAKPHLQALPAGALKTLATGRLAELARTEMAYIQDSLAGRKPSAKHGSKLNVGSSPSAPALKQSTAATPMPTRSPMRHAISLLLQYPEFAQQVNDPEYFAEAGIAGGDLFAELVVAAEQVENTGQLLERFRQHSQAAILQKLATAELFANTNAGANTGNGSSADIDAENSGLTAVSIEADWQGVMAKLSQVAVKAKYAQLSQKSQLTEQDKQQMRLLQKQMH